MGFLELMGHNGTFVKSHTHRAFYLGIGIWNSIQGMSGVYILYMQHSRHRQVDNRRGDVLQVLLATSLTLVSLSFPHHCISLSLSYIVMI